MTTPRLKVWPARTVRVLRPDTIEADIDLGLGTHAHRRVCLDGVRLRTPGEAAAAQFCAVVLLGGKRIIVETYSEAKEGPIAATVYLYERFTAPDASMIKVFPGFDKPALDACRFMKWLSTRGFDKADVISVLQSREVS